MSEGLFEGEGGGEGESLDLFGRLGEVRGTFEDAINSPVGKRIEKLMSNWFL